MSANTIKKESKWSGTVENAFFNGDVFDRNRKLQKPEYEYSGRTGTRAYYILSVDVGRKGCDSVISVIRVNPQTQGLAIKSLVNIFTLSDDHFEHQAMFIKKLFYKYRAQAIVIDGNGLGIGLIDYMVKSQRDDDTGEEFPSFGIINDEEGYYKKFRTSDTEINAIYIIKATAPINTEAHANAQTQMTAGKVKFLIDERTAKIKLLETSKGAKMTPEERGEYLKPFTLTTILKEEINSLFPYLEMNRKINSLIARNPLEFFIPRYYSNIICSK